jgi:hypothetical protein
MNVLQAAVLGLALFALLHWRIVPRLRKELASPDPQGLIRRIGLYLGAQIARSASLLVATTLGVVAMFVLLGPRLIPHLSVTNYAAAFKAMRSLHERAESIDTGWGIALLAVLAVALFVAVRREARAKAQAAVEDAFRRLKEQAAGGELASIPPTSEMQQLLKIRADAAQRGALLLEAAKRNPGLPDPSQDPALRALAQQIQETDERIQQLDIIRRLDFGPGLEPLRAGDRSRQSAFGSFFISRGFLGSLSFGSRALSLVSLLLLVPSLITLAAPSVGEAAERASVELHDLIIARSAKEAEDNWRGSLRPTAAPQAQTQTLSAEDQALIRQLAQQFEKLVQVRNAQLYQLAPSAGRLISSLTARQEILHDFAGTHAQTVALDSHVTHDASVAQAVGGSGDLPREFEDRLTHFAAQADPNAWQAFSTKAKTYLAHMASPATPRDIAQQLFTEALNTAGSAAGGDSSERGLLAQLGGEYLQPGDWVEEAAEVRKLDTFTFLEQVGRGSSQAELPKSADREHGIPLLSNQAEDRARDIAIRLDHVLEQITQSASDPPTLEWTGSGMQDPASAEKRLNQLISSGQVPEESREELSNALASFRDYFPGQVQQEVPTARARFLAGASESAIGQTANLAEEAAASFARARSYGSLRVFAKIGGVLLGLDPQGGEGEGPSIVGLASEDSAQGVFLLLKRDDGKSLRFGPYRAELISHALAYAADGRPIATTMPQGFVTRRVLIHPALANSGIGCEMRHIDQFVDGFTASAPERRQAERAVMQQGSLYRFAWAVQFGRLEPKVVTQIDDQKVTHYLQSVEAQVEKLNDNRDFVREIAQALSANANWKDSQVSPLRVKKDYFDQNLVGILNRCVPQSPDVASFAKCIAATQQTSDYIHSLAWAMLPPKFVPESGVREIPYTLDRDLSFMRQDATSSNPLWPFDFVLELIFESPRYFAQEQHGSVPEETPYEFPAIHEWINDRVWAGVQTSADSSLAARRTLADVREFTVLQRFFRLALSGDLGDHFPLESLRALGKVPPHTPPVAVRTPDWNVFGKKQIDSLEAAGLGPVAVSLGIERDALELQKTGDRCPEILP